MVRRPHPLWPILYTLAVATLSIWYITKSLRPVGPIYPEPSYDGKTLRAWLELYDSYFYKNQITNNPAVEPLKKLCPQSVPLLLDWVRRGGPSESYRLRGLTMHAFVFTGSNAIPAIPELVALLSLPKHEGGDAARALGAIGAPALPAIRQTLHSPDSVVREMGLHAIQFGFSIEDLPEDALQDVVETIFDKDDHVEFIAFGTLEALESRNQIINSALKRRATSGPLGPMAASIAKRYAPDVFAP